MKHRMRNEIEIVAHENANVEARAVLTIPLYDRAEESCCRVRDVPTPVSECRVTDIDQARFAAFVARTQSLR